jgi:hypothetical protein
MTKKSDQVRMWSCGKLISELHQELLCCWRTKQTLPRLDDLSCKVHNLTLEYHSCDVEIVVKIVNEKYCVVTNMGTHHHGKPPAIHATQHGKDKLRQWVENNPGDKPINIMTGTPTKFPLWKDSQEKELSILSSGHCEGRMAHSQYL